MEGVEQENVELRGIVATLQAELERVSAQVAAMTLAQNQPPTTAMTTVVSEILPPPVSVAPTNTMQYTMPDGYPWGMPQEFGPRYQPNTSGFPIAAGPTATNAPQLVVPIPQATTDPRPITTPIQDENVYHGEPSEGMGAYNRFEEFQEQFDKMQQQIKALQGKELFGKNAHDLCLVPNVQVPPKFKVPEFEKYKGDTCPETHLIMYIRKMSTQTDNDQVLIHYFQDSLIGAPFRWYMGLDSSKIHTFRDLGEAFIWQYKYNLDMAPNRDQLRAMS